MDELVDGDFAMNFLKGAEISIDCITNIVFFLIKYLSLSIAELKVLRRFVVDAGNGFLTAIPLM